MKHAIARELIETRNFGISGQVLAELTSNLTKNPRLRLPDEDVDQWLVLLTEMPCAPVDAALVLEARVLSRRHQIDYWDAAIVAAAERLGAPVLYTEDLNDGQAYGSVRVENPFRSH